MAVTGLAAVLLAIAALLVVVSAVQPVARRLEISETVLLALAGIVLGGSADLILRSSYTELFNGAAETLLDFPLNSEAFLLIFLPALVFQGALAIDVRRLAHETATVLLLAVVAVVVSTATIGLALFPFAGLPLSVCLLLGAIVATTDPSAVAGIFRDIGASSRLTRLVEGEALLNDAAAISIFSLLLAAVTSHHRIAPGSALVEFLVSFIGAIVMGVLFGRLTLLMITTIGAAPAAEITLTVALPYIVYILCDEFLGFSGVVAAASAGLTLSVYGPSTFRPQTWRFLNELWQQLVFWAGSLVFVLASMLVPRLLVGMTRWDCVLILLATGAGLLARGAVVFGLLPLLAATRLSPPVPTPFKITMVWGGLRGAITLALALAVTENERVSTPVAHFIGIIATGFVLITLFVNGTTLRYLVLFLKLDQLSPIDQALRHQVLGLGLGEVRDRTREVAEELGFSPGVSDTVITQLGRQVEEEEQANTFDTALGDRQRVTLALIVIANRERSILLDLFRIQGLSRPVMETLLRSAEAMVDGARLEGRFGYVRALRRRLRPSLRFRLAQAIHHRFHFDQPLMSCMTERFEMLMISYFVSLSLIRFMRTRMEPTLGARIGEIVGEVLDRQRKLLNEALQTLRLHYQGYSEALEIRLLQQVSLRLEGEEYDSLLSESLISEELHRELHRDVERRRGHLGAPLIFNIKAGIEARMRALPVFRGLSDEVLHALAPQLSIHFTSPGERLYRRGRRVRSVYFISAGLAETHFPEHDVRFGAGDVIGAEEALSRMPARAVTRSLQFGQFLSMSTRRFRRLVADYPEILANIDELTRTRHMAERSGVTLLPGDSAVLAPSDDAIALATADLSDALPTSAEDQDQDQGRGQEPARSS